MAGGTSRAMSVAELNRTARSLLERGLPLVQVAGEVSGVARPSSGHVYFSLKDGQAQVRCVLWKGRAAAQSFLPRDGDAVEVRAGVTLFEARGDYQLNVESVRRAGAGALYEAFVRLKERLGHEGLFDASRKRALPVFPRAIGIVTSPDAAALRDVVTTLKRRAPMIPLVLYPVPVQGERAAPAIAAALAEANRRADVDLLLVCRGGGSIEDLWAFNEEIVARAVVASSLPVVSGVGHETDFTICDFAADLRAATPTAAAELCAPAATELLARLAGGALALARAAADRVATLRQRLDWSTRELVAPQVRLEAQKKHLEYLARRLASAAQLRLSAMAARADRVAAALRAPDSARWRERLAGQRRSLAFAARAEGTERARRLAALKDALGHLDPQRVLLRGYSLVRDAEGRLVRDAALLATGDLLAIDFANGSAKARVE
ncbi:MAG: exodeoxyribonuclease VII large subunit [Burkholderiales bacterium]|nr:exodeoxyribonuclease VII large subunit [Burkholderiales bacterium]